MEFDSANTKQERPLTLLKIKNIELENNLLLEKQKYILLQSELESAMLIASKQVDVYKSECMLLKEIILMLENDYNSLKKKMKDQEVFKIVNQKIKKVEEIVSSKHGNMEKNDNERGELFANESEVGNRSVIVDTDSGSDDYVQLISKLDSASIKLNNDLRSQREKNLLSESLPLFNVESLRGDEKSVEIADDIDNGSLTPRKRFKCSDCACYLGSETSCEDDKRKKIESTQRSKEKSEADADKLNDNKDSGKKNESETDLPISMLMSEIKEKSTLMLEPEEKLASKSELKVKSASESIFKGVSISELESKAKSALKSKLEEKPSGESSSGGKTKPEMLGKSDPSKKELRMSIWRFLNIVNLKNVTFDDILRELCTLYKRDLTPRKESIKLMIQEEITELAYWIENDEVFRKRRKITCPKPKM